LFNVLSWVVTDYGRLLQIIALHNNIISKTTNRLLMLIFFSFSPLSP